jgi:protein phosphatase
MKLIPGNAQHIGSRTEQQDSFGFSDPENANFLQHGGFLAVLADGAGGMEHGGAASRLAIEIFLGAYQDKSEHETIAAALERALLAANDAVQALAEGENCPDNVATTLVAAVVHRNGLYWIAVGDSALFLYRGEVLSLLTESHTYARRLDEQVAAGLISREAALSHPEREALTSYVGGKEIEEIDKNATPMELLSGDRIVLASDGLFKTLGAHEIAVELANRDPQQACEALVQKVLEKGRKHQDNTTVLCIEVEKEENDHLGASQQAPKTASSRILEWLSSVLG